jgi:hypothetical protein
VSADHLTVDPWELRATYDTLVGYDEVQALATDKFERVLAANPLVKGYTPVYIQMSIAYRLRIGATTTLDNIEMAKAVATFINNFELTHTLDMTAIVHNVRTAFPDLGVIVSPTILAYSLYAPDGQVFTYETQDIVTIFPSYPSNNAHLTNGDATVANPVELALRNPIVNAALDPTASNDFETQFAAANATLRNQLAELGVSDRTLIYLTSADDITFTLVP